MTLNPVCESVETAQGVPLTVTGVAQVKIMKNADLLQTASEQFLGKKEHEIKSTVLQTLEGHLRAILGKKTESDLAVVNKSGLKKQYGPVLSLKVYFNQIDPSCCLVVIRKLLCGPQKTRCLERCLETQMFF
jgi:hypothetical protein